MEPEPQTRPTGRIEIVGRALEDAVCALRPGGENDAVAAQIRARVFDEIFADRSAPARLGRYTVIGEAGRGGLGVVLRAYDPKLRREVALKRMLVVDAALGGPDGRRPPGP